jgi:hypothetical protein
VKKQGKRWQETMSVSSSPEKREKNALFERM